jgi:hypothetical protein
MLRPSALATAAPRNQLDVTVRRAALGQLVAEEKIENLLLAEQ